MRGLMPWNPIESCPKNKWVLVKAVIEKDVGTEEFIEESTEYNHNVFVAKLANEGWWNVNNNTCGCCNRDIKPYEWKEVE